MRDFVNSPAFAALVIAVVSEVRAQLRGRKADREREAFRRELAGLTTDAPTGAREDR